LFFTLCELDFLRGTNATLEVFENDLKSDFHQKAGGPFRALRFGHCDHSQQNRVATTYYLLCFIKTAYQIFQSVD